MGVADPPGTPSPIEPRLFRADRGPDRNSGREFRQMRAMVRHDDSGRFAGTHTKLFAMTGSKTITIRPILQDLVNRVTPANNIKIIVFNLKREFYRDILRMDPLAPVPCSTALIRWVLPGTWPSISRSPTMPDR